MPLRRLAIDYYHGLISKSFAVHESELPETHTSSAQSCSVHFVLESTLHVPSLEPAAAANAAVIEFTCRH